MKRGRTPERFSAAKKGAAAKPASPRPIAKKPGLVIGAFAPWFHARALQGNPRYAFDTVGGRHVLMLFFDSASDPASAAALALVRRHHIVFDDAHACFFGITNTPDDETNGLIEPRLPGIRYFLDFDRAIAEKYRFATPTSGETPDPRCWLLIDPMLRIIGRFPLDQGELAIRTTVALSRSPSPVDNAPALVVPNLLEPQLCKHLIALYLDGQPEASGFMSEVAGKTAVLHDPAHKIRKDYLIEDAPLMRLLGGIVASRLAPVIERAFQFRASRMERYLIAGYEADEGGHFAPHRDNTTKGTAHRRFAVTINLNAEDYEGGDLSFPEFGARRYRAPTGGAVVFSCSLLHQALPVTKGTRYAFLPFLYDDAAANLRDANNRFLAEGVPRYDKMSDRI
jgi:predicted 2-oxoglutarate/Fe(II)-dependent dioxygenase YbiX